MSDKKNAIASTYLKFLFLKKYKLNWNDILYKKNKPVIKHKKYFFSISHCDGCCIFVSDKNKIGIDIEKISKIDKVLKNEFEKYKHEFKNFFEYWTFKEAYFKTFGKLINSKKNKNYIYKKMDNYLICLCSKNKIDNIKLKEIKL